jgi:MFS family permease
MALSTFNYAFSPLSLSPQVPYYMEDFDSTLPEVINFIGVSVLVLGFTNFIWIPLSRGFGRRPVAIFTTLITTASCIWRARATTYDSFLGSAVLCGLGSSPGETLGPVVIADVAFLHERGFWMGLYQWAFWSGLMVRYGGFTFERVARLTRNEQVGPIVAGIMAQDYGWQSFWWLSTAISAFTSLWILFFQPETKWDRRAVAVPPLDGHDLAGTDDPYLKNDLAATTIDTSEPDTASDQDDRARTRPTGKPSKAQLMPVAKWNPHESILAAIWLPVKMLKLPIVIWGALQFNFSANIYLMINITQSQALASPPFNFSPAAVGYTNLALFVGVSFSLVTAGPLSDWISEKATVRNRGIREPEMRLPALVPFALFGLVGCVVTALGFQNGWPWESVVVVGFGFIGVHTAGLSGIAINYVVSILVLRLLNSLIQAADIIFFQSSRSIATSLRPASFWSAPRSSRICLAMGCRGISTIGL